MGLYLFYIVVMVIALLCLRQFLPTEGFEDVSQAEDASPPEVYTDTTVPIKVFFYADKWKPTARALAKSLQKHKYSYEVLGMGKPWEGWTGRTRTYLAAVQRYKAEKGGSALAIFVDGYDVICIKDSDKFYVTYMNRERSMPVIFGAEQSCNINLCNKDILNWFDVNGLNGGRAAIEERMNTWGEANQHLWSQAKPVFINYGMFMGTADGLESLLTKSLETGIDDDQRSAGTVVVADMSSYDLDIEEALFRNRFRDLEKKPDEDGVTGPGFLHFFAMKSDAEQAEVLKRFQAYE